MFFTDPIVGKDLRILGHELLYRGVAKPEKFFKEVSKDIDFRIFNLALAFKKALSLQGLSFLNLKANTLREYSELIKQICPSDVVIEITEGEMLTEAIQELNLCVDDFGREFSNLDRIIQIKPSFVKVDIKLLKDLSNQGLFHLAMTLRDCGVEFLIAEKIENEEEFQKALNSGFDFFQGYFVRYLTGKV